MAKEKINKVVRQLKKASKTHAGQAKTLESIKMKKGGSAKSKTPANVANPSIYARAKAKAKKEEKEKSLIPEELKEEFRKSAVASSEPPSGNLKPQPTPQISKDDILELTAKASQKALEDYEIVRKKRKQEKKVKLAEEKHRQQVRQTIQTAVKGPSRDTTFDFCFA